MDFRKIVVALALVMSGPANADVVTMVDAVETITANINVPTSTNGRLMFKACAEDCDLDFVSVRLTPNTAFYFDEVRLTFAEFRAKFYNLPRASENYALVTYDTQAKIVTSVDVKD